VDDTFGFRTVLSDFGDSTQGPLGVDPQGVAVEASGTLLVVDSEAGTNGKGLLFRVDPVTGVRTVLTDFGNPDQGQILGENPRGVAVDGSGSILVQDPIGSGPCYSVVPQGALFRVDPVTGYRFVLSYFSSTAQGLQGYGPCTVAVRGLDQILVGGFVAPAGQTPSYPTLGSALFSVNPVTGVRTILSRFEYLSPAVAEDFSGVAVGASGEIWVTSIPFSAPLQPVLSRVDPATGGRTVVSDFKNEAQGAPAESLALRGLAVSPSSGTVFVVDRDGSKLFGVNPVTGIRTVVSDFGNASQGPVGYYPAGVAALPH
jgi:hypothetical protein